MLEEYWFLVEKYSDDKYSIYYFWLADNKKWILEFLRNKWTQFLPPLDHCINKIEEFYPQYGPTLCIESEEYFEKLLKYAVVLQKIKQLKFREYLKKRQSSKL